MASAPPPLAEEAVWLFGEKMKLSRIAAVTQAHCRRHLILNLFTKPDVCMPSVNNITAREALPESLQFGRAVPPHPAGSLGGRPSPGSGPGV